MIIWNYKDRFSSSATTVDPNEISNTFIPTTSIISMSTSKNKGSPNGGFEVTLAPTFNWVSRITAGSWCVLLMSANTKIENLEYVGNVDERTFRMLGRIESVRTQLAVDSNGVRQQRFIVTGVDWGDVFNSVLYIDPIMSNSALARDGNLAMSKRLLYNSNTQTDQDGAAPSTTEIAEAILNLWGSPLPEIFGKLKTNDGIAASSEKQYVLPVEVASYMGLVGKSNTFADLLNILSGPLGQGYDEYKDGHVEAQTLIEPSALLGTNSLWSLLTRFTNPLLNELVADIRFNGGGGDIDSFEYNAANSTPSLTLYKRIRPFTINDKIQGDDTNGDPSSLEGVDGNISYFKNIRKILIPLNNVTSFSAGTNWKAKKNFIEVQPRIAGIRDVFDNQLKKNMQTLDNSAYQREGFRPIIEVATAAPYDKTKGPLLKVVTNWKYLLRDWHFNSHLMMNGNVTFAGIDRYIQVGDNIVIDARVMGLEQNYNDEQTRNKIKSTKPEHGPIYFMAHVEGVSHNITVGDNGARSFMTTVSFVRGILANKSGEPVDNDLKGMLDTDSSLLSNVEERMDNSNIKTQLGLDPFPMLRNK